MHRIRIPFTRLLIACALLSPLPAAAHDVDGPDDCQRHLHDMGDAPEGIDAYPGIPGHFPTCLVPGAVGGREFNCPPLGTAPGPTGYVIHDTPATALKYWLGCGSAATGPLGIDSEADGKVNPVGAGSGSACAPNVLVDCAETAFGLTFGQDECYGDDDAGLTAPPALTTCSVSSVSFRAYSCSAVAVQVVLNILVDMNHDGDWNDNVYCNTQGACGNEWAVRNVVITLQPGCNTITSPPFRVGPNAVDSWMRISLSDQPVNDDFPWAGSATTPGGVLAGGETEDYPLAIRPDEPQPCQTGYHDFGDAPENIAAYPGGVTGHFPTCTAPSAPGTAELACGANDPPPGPTGYVEHVTLATDASKVGLGCGNNPLLSTLSVDGEADGKVNTIGAGSGSACSAAVLTDVAAVAFGGMTFGQDETFGDADAGVSPVAFTVCKPATVSFQTFNCGQPVEGYLNVLVDMNEDGDWNDNFACGTQCAKEWAVRNQLVPLPAGCKAQVSLSFLVGPRAGHGWMRVSLTLEPVPPDFPWNGSAGMPAGTFRGGETEDYPVEIAGDCHIAYRDFGDAPEGFAATTLYTGHYPTCAAAAVTAGSQELECGAPQSIAPPAGAVAGHVEHVVTATGPSHFWFGCGPVPAFGVDSENDGKTSPGAALSTCGQVPVDCIENAFGLAFGQDECYGDGDAGLATTVEFRACSTATVTYQAYSCDQAQDAYLNILVDWNTDGDWNDNSGCGAVGTAGGCAPEWAVKNVPITLLPGCSTYTSPSFNVGRVRGGSWMRMTLSPEPVPNDFPWNGSVSTPNGAFMGGETEDYPVRVVNSTTDVGFVAPTGGLWLAAPSPNPGTRATTLRFALPHETSVKLTIYDLVGRRVARLVDGTLPAGQHAVNWDYRNSAGSETPVGWYVVKLEADGRVFTQPAVRAR